MKKRNVFCILLTLCLLVTSLAGCGAAGEIQLPMGHRYGNPEVTYADGQATVKHTCVDCGYEVTEIRTGATQVADAAAWQTAFENLNKSNYSLLFAQIEDGEVKETQSCVVEETKGYYGYTGYGDNAFYTLQKSDESFITYIIDNEEDTRVAGETDDTYWLQLKKVSSLFPNLGEQFDQFTYDAESGSYVNTAPIAVEMIGYEGEALTSMTFDPITVNIGDGSICQIKGSYTVTNDLLEEWRIDYCLYNIGFSVVKVPQALIDEVSGSNGPKDPMDYFTYEIKNAEATLKSVDPALSGNVVIPAAVGEYPLVAIGGDAFRDCKNLTGVTIPGSVTKIGDFAFYGCEGLESVTYAGTQEQWENVYVSESGNEYFLAVTVQFDAECAHNYGEGVVTKEATCGAAGVKTYTCALCGDEKTEVITAILGHSYDEGIIIEDATCTDAGIKVYTCAVCGKNKTEYVPKLDTHTYVNGTCIHCGADDPMYTPDTGDSAKPEGIFGTIITLIQSIIELFAYFK